MATLLNGVNRLLQRVGRGNSGNALASLTDSAKQIDIDLAVQLLNEVVDDLYESARHPRPNVLASATITLATDDRDYALNAAVNILHWPFHDLTNGRYIYQWPGDFLSLYHGQQIPGNESGMPYYGAISPEDGEVYLDKLPTADENGLVYTYWYEADQELTLAADNFPFKDVVYRGVVAAAAMLWERERNNKFDSALYSASIGRAARYLLQEEGSLTWHPFSRVIRSTDPLDAD